MTPRFSSGPASSKFALRGAQSKNWPKGRSGITDSTTCPTASMTVWSRESTAKHIVNAYSWHTKAPASTGGLLTLLHG